MSVKMHKIDNHEDLFDELPEKGWELDIQDLSTEKLHLSENDKYLVPIYAIEDETLVFRGNGVIVNSYLVTAAHVAQTEDGKFNYQKIWYQFEDSLLEVTDEDIAHDGRNVGVIDDNNDDVIIYKLNDLIGNYVCNVEEVTVSMELFAYPYTNFGDKLIKSGGLCKVQSLEVGSGKGDGIVWKNCFKVNYPFRCTYGNSGSAVFVKNVLYGILIEMYIMGEGAYGKVIDARYINKQIKDYEIKKSH